MIYRALNKGDQNIRYYIKQWKIKRTSEILNDIREHRTLVNFMDIIGNANHAVIISVNWKFDSNYEKSLPLENNHWILYFLLHMAKK